MNYYDQSWGLYLHILSFVGAFAPAPPLLPPLAKSATCVKKFLKKQLAGTNLIFNCGFTFV